MFQPQNYSCTETLFTNLSLYSMKASHAEAGVISLSSLVTKIDDVTSWCPGKRTFVILLPGDEYINRKPELCVSLRDRNRAG